MEYQHTHCILVMSLFKVNIFYSFWHILYEGDVFMFCLCILCVSIALFHDFWSLNGSCYWCFFFKKYFVVILPKCTSLLCLHLSKIDNGNSEWSILVAITLDWFQLHVYVAVSCNWESCCNIISVLSFWLKRIQIQSSLVEWI